jgi:hypothetical protein
MSRLSDARPGDDFPTVSRRERFLSEVLWLGVPGALVVAGVAAVLTGWPPLVFVVLLPPAGGLVAIRLWGRSQPFLRGWDQEGLHFTSRSRLETVRWHEIEWFWKLWPTQRLDGTGRTWITTIVKCSLGGSSRTVLVTVSGTGPAGAFGGVLAGSFETVFDRQVPEKNWARRT